MKLVLAALLGLAASSVWAQKDKIFHQNIRPFIKQATGVYEQRLTGEQFSEREKQPQDFVYYPIWKTDTSQWFYMGWFSPMQKERPLDQIFMEFSRQSDQAEGKNCKVYWYAIPQPERFSKEWAKKQPFEGLDPATVKVESPLLTQGWLECPKADAPYYDWRTSSPLPRGGNSPYASVDINARFYGEAMSLAMRFYTPNNELMMEQTHSLKVQKKKIKLKKY